MNELEILSKLKEIFNLVINRTADLSAINENSKLVEDLAISSVGLIYLMVAVEETFNIDMSDVTFNSFVTVGDAVKYIKGKIK